MSAVTTLARLTWKRVLRGRTKYPTMVLLAVPPVLAATTLARVEDPASRWSIVAELTLRSLVLLAPVLHLATAVNEENEGKTYTYLWSRPVARQSLLFGKMLALVPGLAALAVLSLAVAYAIVGLGPGEMLPIWLARAALAAPLGVLAASCFAVGIGALFTRHPLVVAFGYVFFGEQILPQVQAIQNISTLYHVKTIAALPRGFVTSGDLGGAVLALAILSAIWLGLAVWRVRRLEFGTADG
jgi:ABC-type transport system involved in multi-copper enzyme maturation permease subunit